MKTLEQIVEWYHRKRAPTLPAEQLVELYFQFHPRTAFLKTLPVGATVADIGAGDGSLSVFRSWPAPAREDLRLYAYSIEKGEKFDDFAGYEISDWNKSPPEFPGLSFDGIVSAHFIEHIDDPASFMEWAARKLVPGGRAYVEWPSADSCELPSRTELLAHGVDLVISRFDDDNTHQALPQRDAMEAAAKRNGLSVTTSGIVRLPWLEEQMMQAYRNSDNRFPVQAAFWAWTGWAQYLVLERPAE